MRATIMTLMVMRPTQLPSISSSNSETQIRDVSLVVVEAALDGLRLGVSLVVAEVTLHLRVRDPLALKESRSTTTMILGTTTLLPVLAVSHFTTMTILGMLDPLLAHAVRLRTAPRARMIRIQSLLVLLTKVPVDVEKIVDPDCEANLCTITKICLTRCQRSIADLIIVERIEHTLVVTRMIHTTTNLIIVEKIEDILVMTILPTTKGPTHQCPLLGELDLIMIISTIIQIRTTGIQADNGHLCPLVSGASNFPRRSLQKEAVPHIRSFQRTNSALLIMVGITHASSALLITVDMTHASSALLTTASTIHTSPDLKRADTIPASSSPAGMAAITQDHLAPMSPAHRLAPLSMVMSIPPSPAHHLAIPTNPPAAHPPPLTTHAAIPRPPPNPSTSSIQHVITPFSAFPEPPHLTRSKPRIAR